MTSRRSTTPCACWRNSPVDATEPGSGSGSGDHRIVTAAIAFGAQQIVAQSKTGAAPIKSFRTRIEADRYRGLLLQAVQTGGRFDETTGEPEWWQTPLAEARVHEWSRR